MSADIEAIRERFNGMTFMPEDWLDIATLFAEIKRLTAQRDAALRIIADASDIGDGWAQELLYDLRSALGVTE